jgi:hypothetical protein
MGATVHGNGVPCHPLCHPLHRRQRGTPMRSYEHRSQFRDRRLRTEPYQVRSRVPPAEALYPGDTMHRIAAISHSDPT